jgi:hypothetical protein
MSPAEAAFRGLEQVRRLTDRLRRPGWRGGFTGAICGLPGLERSKTGDVVFDEQVRAEASAALAGRFAFFGQTWPTDGRETWWLGDIWRLDPVTGAFWPGAERWCHDIDYRGVAGSDGPQRGDVKFVWELNRLQFLPVIALDAARRGEPDATERIFHILKGWMANNPPYRGVNWTGGIEAASRVISLLAALAFVRPETAEDEAAVRLFLKAHVHWILRHPSRFSSSNNHRVAELTALVVAGLCAPDLSRAGGLFRRAKAGLEREMLRQFHEDGVGAEQSVHYAAYSLEWFMLAGFACDVAGSPMSAGFKARTRRVLDHLLWAIDTGGRALRTGDDDAARVLALTQAPEPRYAASVADLTARWLGCAGPAPETRDVALRDLIGRPVPIAEPPVGRRTFPHGGLTVWRRPVSGAPMLLAFDHGPLGHLSIAAHGHADALSVWLYWGEEAIFTGAGTYLYHGDGALRDALRGTAAHNTLTLKGQDQSRILGPFAWGRAARTTLLRAADDEAEAEHDGYRRRFGLIHRRRVLVENDNVAIEDDVIGSSPQRTPWSLGFTLAPGVAVRLWGPRAMLRTQAGRRLVLIGEALEGQPLSWTCVETPYAETFGDLRRTFRLILSGDGRTTPAVRTQILFSPTGDHQDSP